MAGKPGRPRSLTIEQIAQAALDDGLATFSMPSVSRRVGVAHSALYRYVTNRDELLYLSLERALAVANWPDTDQPWRDLLTQLGEAAWDLCDRFPGFDRAMSTVNSYPQTWVTQIQKYKDSLVKQGFSDEDAWIVLGFVCRLALTSSRERTRLRGMVSAGTLDRTSPLVDPADRGWFDRQLEIVLAGAAQLLT